MYCCRWCVLLALSISATIPMMSAAEELVVAVHESVAEDLDKRLVRSAYLGLKTTWKDAAVVLVLSREEASRNGVQELTGREHQRLLRGWKRLTFSGNGRMPKVVSKDVDALTVVSQTRGAIALVARPAGAVPSGIRLIPLETLLAARK